MVVHIEKHGTMYTILSQDMIYHLQSDFIQDCPCKLLCKETLYLQLYQPCQ